MASGASKGAKKINPFNDGVLVGVNQGPSTPVRIYEGGDGKPFVFPVKQPFKIRKVKKGQA